VGLELGIARQDSACPDYGWFPHFALVVSSSHRDTTAHRRIKSKPRETPFALLCTPAGSSDDGRRSPSPPAPPGSGASFPGPAAASVSWAVLYGMESA